MSIADAYFDQLEDWKKLPAYRLETRIDSIVGFALPQILKHSLGVGVRTVIPELPLRIGTIFPHRDGTRDQNLSKKVDFYVQTDEGESLFIEFKSDSGSRRSEQDDYLLAAAEVGMNAVVAGILRIREATKAKGKYAHLIEKMSAAGLVEGGEACVQNDTIRVVYIQPHIEDGDAVAEVVGFQQVSESILAGFPDDEFMHRFARSLARWLVD